MTDSTSEVVAGDALLEVALFEDPVTITCAVCGGPAEPRREYAPVCVPCGEIIHYLMPNMSYACYENILSVAGHWKPDYSKVTCPGCITEGWDNIVTRKRRQMGQCPECGTRLGKKDVCPEGCS